LGKGKGSKKVAQGVVAHTTHINRKQTSLILARTYTNGESPNRGHDRKDQVFVKNGGIEIGLVGVTGVKRGVEEETHTGKSRHGRA